MFLIAVDEDGSPIYSTSYNSNSYARGLLDAVGIQYENPESDGIILSNWDNPVAPRYFGK